MRNYLSDFTHNLFNFLELIKDYYFYQDSNISEASLYITNKCNSDCIYCGKNSLSKDKDLSKKEIISLLNELKYMGTKRINILGGEPFVRKDIWEIIEYIGSRGFFLSVVSNGLSVINFDRNKINILKKNVNLLDISFDSPVKRTEDYIRGVNGDYEKTLSGIESLTKNGIPVRVTTVISKYNFKDIPELIRLIARKGCKSINLQPVCPVKIFSKSNSKDGSYFLESDDLNDLKKSILLSKKVAKSLNLKNSLSLTEMWIYSYFINEKGWYRNLIRDFKCIVPYRNIIIYPNGDIAPCLLSPLFGNIRNSSLRNEIKKIKSFKQSIKKQLPSYCDNCFCYFTLNMIFSILTSPIKNRSHLFNIIKNVAGKYHR